VRATMPVRSDRAHAEMDLRDGSRGLFYQQRTFAKPMVVLLTMVGFVLLLACANIANLMLARGSQRQREMSVRLALGAGRVRIARQMLVESVMLGSAGRRGRSGARIYRERLIPKLTTNAWEQVDFHIHFDWMVFAFTTGITLATGILFGLAPAFAGGLCQGQQWIEGDIAIGDAAAQGLGRTRWSAFRSRFLRCWWSARGLFLRTLASLNAVPLGFNADHLLLAEINPPQKLYPAGKDMELHSNC
jgi:hypothetical protein